MKMIKAACKTLIPLDIFLQLDIKQSCEIVGKSKLSLTVLMQLSEGKQQKNPW